MRRLLFGLLGLQVILLAYWTTRNLTRGCESSEINVRSQARVCITRDDFKWRGSHAGNPTWTGVYLTSNDRIENYTRVVDDIRKLMGDEPYDLLTVIGGQYYYKLLSDLDFREVILFDQNVNEHIKEMHVRALVQTSTSWHDFTIRHRKFCDRVITDFEAEFTGSRVRLQISNEFFFYNKDRRLSFLHPDTNAHYTSFWAGINLHKLAKQDYHHCSYMPGVPRLTNKNLVVFISNSGMPITKDNICPTCDKFVVIASTAMSYQELYGPG